MRIKVVLFIILLIVLAVLNVAVGSVSIPLSDVLSVILHGRCQNDAYTFIILQSRLPQMVTAVLCGGSLAVSGLMLQTTFHNPLAGPSILGISSGASLGVAVVMLLFGGSVAAGLAGGIVILAAALIGSAIVLGILLLLSAIVRNELVLLIVGIILSYLTSSGITLLNYFASEQSIHSYIIWGMGNFGNVTNNQLPMFVIVTLTGWLGAMMLVKPLNALLLGNEYAQNLGINVRRTYQLLLLVTGVLTAVTTAYCGPVAFIGLAVPHLARLIFRTSHHGMLLPLTLLTGCCVALLCNLLCILPSGGTVLPINSVTPVIGVPIILYVILRGYRDKIQFFGRKVFGKDIQIQSSEALLCTSGLSIGYGSKVVKDSISLNLEAGSLVCVLGRNGTGKSTLLHTLARLQRTLGGSISISGKDICRYSYNELSRTVGVVLTSRVNIEDMKVHQVVALGRLPYTNFTGKLNDDDYMIVDEAIQKVSLSHKHDSYINNLSDGERQKVLIAKVLAQGCRIMILDEPTAFLDEQSQDDLMRLLRHIAHDENKLVILSTHHISLAKQYADDIVELS